MTGKKINLILEEIKTTNKQHTMETTQTKKETIFVHLITFLFINLFWGGILFGLGSLTHFTFDISDWSWITRGVLGFLFFMGVLTTLAKSLESFNRR